MIEATVGVALLRWLLVSLLEVWREIKVGGTTAKETPGVIGGGIRIEGKVVGGGIEIKDRRKIGTLGAEILGREIGSPRGGQTKVGRGGEGTLRM